MAFIFGTVFITGIIGLYSVVLVSFLSVINVSNYSWIALEDLNEEQAKIGSAGL
jgi:FHS family L-fucose permease-like MFS transporter